MLKTTLADLSRNALIQYLIDETGIARVTDNWGNAFTVIPHIGRDSLSVILVDIFSGDLLNEWKFIDSAAFERFLKDFWKEEAAHTDGKPMSEDKFNRLQMFTNR